MKELKNNLKEFKELIEKYNSITIEDIEQADMFLDDGYDCYDTSGIMETLTGFGSVSTCTLCNALDVKHYMGIYPCKGCIWLIQTKTLCTLGENYDSYELIETATTNQELLEAIKYRAEYINEVLNEYLKDEKSKV